MLAVPGIVMVGTLSGGSTAQGNFSRNSTELGHSCTDVRIDANQNQKATVPPANSLLPYGQPMDG